MYTLNNFKTGGRYAGRNNHTKMRTVTCGNKIRKSVLCEDDKLVSDGVMANYAPTDDVIEDCKNLGAALA